MTRLVRTLFTSAVLLAVGSGVLRGPAAQGAEPDLCPVPGEVLASAPTLPAVGAALNAGRTVTILAVGTSSTLAGGEGYPHMMLEALQRAIPSAKLQLSTAGARGLTAAELVPVLRHAIAKHRPTLVLWQTGTVDAVQGVRPEDVADAIEEGARLAAGAGADLILIDPQYSRFLVENVDLSPYEEMLRDEAGSLSHVALFPRFQLMEGWADSGQLDLEAAPRQRRAETAALVHACVGQALARYILAGLSRGVGGHAAQ